MAKTSDETTRDPHIGEPVVFRDGIDSDLIPGQIAQVIYGEEDSKPTGEVKLVVFSPHDGVDVQFAKYHQGCGYALTWCWPGEAV